MASTAAAFVAAASFTFWLRASTDSVVGATVVPVDVEAAGVDPCVDPADDPADDPGVDPVGVDPVGVDPVGVDPVGVRVA